MDAEYVVHVVQSDDPLIVRAYGPFGEDEAVAAAQRLEQEGSDEGRHVTALPLKVEPLPDPDAVAAEKAAAAKVKPPPK